MNGLLDVDRTSFEFLSGDLVVVGGDYGTLVLEGTSPEARHALDEIIAGVRRGDRVDARDLVVTLDHNKTLVVEDRHAGLERVARFDGAAIADESSGEEGSAPQSVANGDAEGGP